MSYDPKNRAGNKIADAVSEAIDAGMSPREFVQCAAEAWRETLLEHVEHARKDFNELLTRALSSKEEA